MKSHCLKTLEKFQSSLQHVNLPIRDPVHYNTRNLIPSSLLFERVRKLELLVHDFSTKRKFNRFFSRLFFDRTSQLKRLYLCLDIVRYPHRKLYRMWHSLSNVTDVQISLHDNLKELTLNNISLRHSTWFIHMLDPSNFLLIDSPQVGAFTLQNLSVHLKLQRR
jgi:hypothetical protein